MHPQALKLLCLTPTIHVQAAREDLSYKKKDKEDTPWDKCEARHARVRIEEKLGQKRPLTNWVHGVNAASAGLRLARLGGCSNRAGSRQYGYRLHAPRQAPRRCKLQDKCVGFISKCRSNDPTKAKLGICPCLTPSLCAYVTNQGRPVVGVETLALQGIPIDDLLLTGDRRRSHLALRERLRLRRLLDLLFLLRFFHFPWASLGA